VILSEDHTLPLVSVNVLYHVGPAYERPGRTGFAHLFEHMMAQGSQHVPGEAYFTYLEAAGATDINGGTDFDQTTYYATLPSNQLELALWLESDRMGFLLPGVDRQRLAAEKDVVRNERRHGMESRPYALVEEAIYHLLFPERHPYYGHVMGSHRDIEAARFSDLLDFARQYYTPNNATFAIVGDFEIQQIKTLVEKYFGSMPSGPSVEKISATTPIVRSERRAVVTDQVQLPTVYMAWLTPGFYQPGDAECDFLAQILGGGKASRMYMKLVEEKQIAPGREKFFQFFGDSLFEVAGLDPGTAFAMSWTHALPKRTGYTHSMSLGWATLQPPRFAPSNAPLYSTRYKNFAPRIGVAYQIAQSPQFSTVLRSGFGKFYDLGVDSAASGFDSIPFVFQGKYSQVPYPGSNLPGPPAFTLTPPSIRFTASIRA
jgi:hypothetical protein